LRSDERHTRVVAMDPRDRGARILVGSDASDHRTAVNTRRCRSPGGLWTSANRGGIDAIQPGFGRTPAHSWVQAQKQQPHERSRCKTSPQAQGNTRPVVHGPQLVFSEDRW